MVIGNKCDLEENKVVNDIDKHVDSINIYLEFQATNSNRYC